MVSSGQVALVFASCGPRATQISESHLYFMGPPARSPFRIYALCAMSIYGMAHSCSANHTNLKLGAWGLDMKTGISNASGSNPVLFVRAHAEDHFHSST